LDHTFNIVTRDGVWRAGVAIEKRLSSGRARQSGRSIAASDACDAKLDETCGAAFDVLAPLAESVPDGRVRAVAAVRRVSSANGEEEWTSAAMTVTIGGISIVTTPEHLSDDVTWLRGVAPPASAAPFDYRGWPIVWNRGSASVLLHEAIGHAAEEDAQRLAWPSWLRVRDEPLFRIDDAGNVARAANLLDEPPASYRRATFRDVPIRRMTRVIVDHAGAPSSLPERHIEVNLAGGGHYDPLSEVVMLTVTNAHRVNGSRRESLPPFVIRESRERIRASLAGAAGPPVRYPGVVCSTDGQKLVVDCLAPRIVTSELR
jgi:hypothetical protein